MRSLFTYRTNTKPFLSRIIRGLGFVFFLWVCGFLWFCATIPEERPLPDSEGIDAIVVFTGSAGRIKAGLVALEAGIGERLLVSGVNPTLAPTLIRSALPGDSRLISCCIDLGRTALDTEGNATEAVEWARHRDYRTIMLVTADWHMRRSLVEMSRHKDMPVLYTAPVKSEVAWSRLIIEYNKYLAAKGRSLLI